MVGYLHRLKLVMGVEISTRPVKRSGSPGNARNRTSRNSAAPAKTLALLLNAMVIDMAFLGPKPGEIIKLLVCRGPDISLELRSLGGHLSDSLTVHYGSRGAVH
jgi:hypothetical protein